jgi:hypothetical protein
LAKAQIHTLRNQLLKLAAVIFKNYASYPALLCESLAECVDLADGAACVEQRIAAAKAAGRRDVKNQAHLPCREGGGVGRHPARQKNRSVCRCQCVKKADPSEHQGQHGRKKYYGEICGLAKRGITANAVAPSGLADDFNAPLFAMMPAKEFIKANTALDRVGISKDVGGVIAFLCTAQSSLVNGAVLNIDGGYHL